MKLKFTMAFLLGTVLAFVSSARATTIRSGSSYGPQASYSDCYTDITEDPSNGCMGAQLDGAIDGYTVYQLDFNQGGFTSGDWQVVDVTDLGVDASITLPVLLTNPTITGVMECGSSTSGFVDTSAATPTELTPNVPCTGNDVASDDVSQSLATFTNTSTSAIDLVLFTADGNLIPASVATPEPGGLLLLGAGLVTMFALRRRRLARS